MPVEAGRESFDLQLVEILRGAPPPIWGVGMTIRSIAGLALRVGMLDALGPVRLARANITPSDRMELSARGAMILAGGQKALLATMDRRAVDSTRRSPGVLYGELYVWLDRTDDDGLAWVRDTLRLHASGALHDRGEHIIFGSVVVPASRSLDEAVAVDAFGVALNAARARPGSDFEALRLALNLSRAQINNARGGVEALLDGSVRHFCGTYRYDVSAVIGLLEQAAKLPRYDVAPDGMVAVMEVRVLNRSWSAVYRAIRSGTIAVTGILAGKIGLPALLVDVRDVVAAFPVHRQQWSVPTLSLAEARERTGFRFATMTALRKAGLLTYAERCARDWRTVAGPTVETIEACKRNLVTAGELQRLSDRNFQQVLAAMAGAGVSWIVEGRGSVQYVFPRAEALRALDIAVGTAA